VRACPEEVRGEGEADVACCAEDEDVGHFGLGGGGCYGMDRGVLVAVGRNCLTTRKNGLGVLGIRAVVK
jgi:hypothetical protein